MAIELHIWGPAFGLPSIDPECLAAISFLAAYAAPSEWVIVESSDPAVSPTRTLPALFHQGAWICGYDEIVAYIVTNETASKCLERPPAELEPLQHADLTAYATFVRSQGAPLLALSLYVSTSNWEGSTRPVYSRLLNFPLPWIVPLGLRQRAHLAAEHLGLSSLDTDTLATEKKSRSQTEIKELQKSGTFRALQSRLHAVTRGGISPEVRSGIKLDSLASQFFTPLEALLKSTNMGKTFMLSGAQPTALDCLAFGYLALMLFPELPSRFLADTMTYRHKELVRFTQLMRNIFRKRSEIQAIRPSPSISVNIVRFLGDVISRIPHFGPIYMRRKRRQAENSLLGNTTVISWELFDFLHVGKQIVLGTVLGSVLLSYFGMLKIGPGSSGHAPWIRSKDMGEAGKLLQMAFRSYSPAVGINGL